MGSILQHDSWVKNCAFVVWNLSIIEFLEKRMTSHRLCICLCLRRAEMKMTIYSQERHVLSTRVVSPGEARVDELRNVPSLTGGNGLGFGCGIPSRMSRAVHLCPPPTRLLCSTWHVPASDSSATFTKDMIPVYVWCLTSCDKWEFFLKRVFQVRLKKKKYRFFP